MSISGSFEGMPPLDLLQWIASFRKNGVLSVASEKETRNVFFLNGNIVGVISSRAKDKLGALLLRKEIITEEDLLEIRDDQVMRQTQIGKILLKAKKITNEKLQDALSDQALEIIFELISWKEGEFVFDERDLKESENLVPPILTNNILLEGTRRLDEWDRIRSVVHSDSMVVRRIDGAGVTFNDSLAMKIWNYLERPRTVKEISQAINASEFNLNDCIRRLLEANTVTQDKQHEEELSQKSEQCISHIERAKELILLQGYHEALSHLEKAQVLIPQKKIVLDIKKNIIAKIIKEAKKMFGDGSVIPKARQTISSLTPENLSLSTSEGFVFSRIDGYTNIKSLKYLTNIPEETLYLILHKFARMGLIYLENPKPSVGRHTP